MSMCSRQVAEDNDGTDATDNDDATVDFTDVAPTIAGNQDHRVRSLSTGNRR